MKDYLLIKAELLTEGVRADAKALEGVGTGFKEQNHGLFGWDFENHTKLAIPDDFFLEDGSVVQFRLNKLSPFVSANRVIVSNFSKVKSLCAQPPGSNGRIFIGKKQAAVLKW